MDNSRHALTYSSDLIIRSPGVLSSLCVFFDTVFLPYLPPAGSGGEFLRVFRDDKSAFVDLVDSDFDQHWHTWDRARAELFDGGALQRLPPLTKDVTVDDSALDAIMASLTPNVSGSSRRMYFLARVAHHLRSDHPVPLLIDTEQEMPSRKGYGWLLAHEAFSYVVPELSELEPSQVLEVRDSLSDTREGFAMHLQKLSRIVESRVNSCDSLESIAAHARAVVEAEIIPDFAEFRRQLTSNRASFWSKVMNAAGGALKLLAPAGAIDWASMGMATFGSAINHAGEHARARASNANLAFRFLERLESDVEHAIK